MATDAGCTAAQAQIHPVPATGQRGDDIITFAYNPTGYWTLEHPLDEEGNAPPIAIYRLGTSEDFFVTPPYPDGWLCSFGFCSYSSQLMGDGELVVGFQSIRNGGARPGLTADQLSEILSIQIVLLGGQLLEEVDLRVVTPLPGDFDGNGVVDVIDLEILRDRGSHGWRPVLGSIYDLNFDDAIDAEDYRIWNEFQTGAFFGDANRDGRFDSSDLVAVFEAGEYEDDIKRNSSWSTGDWNGDLDFTNSDLILAFQRGHYDIGPASVAGDFNRNGMLDLDDINSLLVEIIRGRGERFDLNSDGVLDDQDIAMWVDLKGTYLGDANLDGEFNSSDFVLVFQADKFKQDVEAFWHEGDWNGDGDFDTGDLVVAFQDGGYEKGPRPAMAPEPSAILLLVIGVSLICKHRRYYHDQHAT